MKDDLPEKSEGDDRPQKASRHILHDEIVEGIDALDQRAVTLFLSGLSAGLDVSFSLLLMTVIWTLTAETFSEPIVKILAANMYSVGVIFVVLGRSELYTEQTTLAVLPVLNKRAPVAGLLRLWVIVYCANLIGVAAFAWMMTQVGPALGVIDPHAFGVFAHPLTDHPGWVIFCSAVLAGWLMGLLSWLVAASRDTISQIVVVWLIATAIGLCKLHHVVIGSAEVLAGMFANQGISAADYFHFLLWATLGNTVGGSFFVALIKYGYAMKGNKPERARHRH